MSPSIVPVSGRDDPAQQRVREWFLDIGTSMWLPLYAHVGARDARVGVYCALAPSSYRATALSSPGWDLHIGDGRPGFSQTNDGKGGWITSYERFSREPVEPLVFIREFHSVRANYAELSEEFRLFHNLYEDRAAGQLFEIDDAGNAAVAAHLERNEVRVLTPLVRQYQAARQLDLLLFIDSSVDYDPALAAPKAQEWRTDALNASLSSGELSSDRPFSILMATRVLPPPAVEHAGAWPYEKGDKHYPEFIIGMTDLGEPVTFACDPDKLANFFGGNAGAPFYVTPVHFRRDVLAKYYARPDLYHVEDGYLRCAGLWGVRMDNDGPDTVVLWLGDIGRDLPASERDYWRSFNVPPARRISRSSYRRQILAEFADAEAADHRFRAAYVDLREAWLQRFGWPLYRDPEPGDAHLLDVVRRPLQDTDVEFEELVRTLAKLLVDFLNEAELVRPLPPGAAAEKGIAKLERWLRREAYGDVDRDVRLLRDLQEVRSRGAAHRKGSTYEKTLDRVFGPKRKAAAGEMLLEECLKLVERLIAFAIRKPVETP